MEASKRIEWMEYLKAFTCFLVLFGHILMSLQSIAIGNIKVISRFLICFIYLFHMPLFMCMSGIFYHRGKKIKTIEDYKKFEIKKIINLSIPYFIFYTMFMILNTMFSSSVNTAEGTDGWIGMFNNPVGAFWFLYALLSIFIVTPILEKICNYKVNVVFVVFLIFKIISIFFETNIYFLDSIFKNGVYFYFGCILNIENKEEKKITIIKSICFTVSAITIYLIYYDADTYFVNITKIIFGLLGTDIMINCFKHVNKLKFLDTFKKYTFQIYLTHTIFAAGFRIFLYKIGIVLYPIHLIGGIMVSIYLPVLMSVISEKIKITQVLFYPYETIRKIKLSK